MPKLEGFEIIIILIIVLTFIGLIGWHGIETYKSIRLSELKQCVPEVQASAVGKGGGS
jgi:hypothetical protein